MGMRIIGNHFVAEIDSHPSGPNMYTTKEDHPIKPTHARRFPGKTYPRSPSSSEIGAVNIVRRLGPTPPWYSSGRATA